MTKICVLYQKMYLRNSKRMKSIFIDATKEDYFSVNLHTFWELLKCKIRGIAIAYSSFLKMNIVSDEAFLKVNLQKLQNEYEIKPRTDLANGFQAKKEWKLLIEMKISGIMAVVKSRWEA